MERRRMNNLATVLFALFLAFVAALENVDIGYTVMSTGSLSTAGPAIRGMSEFLGGFNET